MKTLVNVGLMVAAVATGYSADIVTDSTTPFGKVLAELIANAPQPGDDNNPFGHAEVKPGVGSVSNPGEDVTEAQVLSQVDENVLGSANVDTNPAKAALKVEEAKDDLSKGPLTSDGGEESASKIELDSKLANPASGLLTNARPTAAPAA